MATIAMLILQLLTGATATLAATGTENQTLLGEWKDAAVTANRVMEQLRNKSREELLKLPNRELLSNTGLPASFEVAIEQGAMLNGTVLVEVEVGRFLADTRWQGVISSFEVTPEGKVTTYPQRIERKSAEERKRSLEWLKG